MFDPIRYDGVFDFQVCFAFWVLGASESDIVFFFTIAMHIVSAHRTDWIFISDFIVENKLTGTKNADIALLAIWNPSVTINCV